MRFIPICGLIFCAALAQAQTAAETQPSIVVRSDPEYSAEATRAFVQSTVILSIVVGVDGKAHDVKVAQGSGFGLDQQAIEAIDKWVFTPGTRDGHPVAMPANVEMNFHLQVRNDTEDHSNQFARLNFTLPPNATRPELILGRLPGNPAAAGDQALRIHLQVDVNGVPKNMNVVSSTDKAWDDQAVRTILAWRFRPASLDGAAISAEGVFELAHSAPPEPAPIVIQEDEPEREPGRVPAPVPVSGLIARGGHTATRLANGTVLLAGGAEPGTPGHELAAAQIFDWVTRTISDTGNMLTARERHSATLLRDGTVLIAGGVAGGHALASAEIFDPSTGKFSAAGNMRDARSSHVAALLPDGRVLICGGTGADGKALASAEIYDPRAKAFMPASAMAAPEAFLNAVTLKDGRIFLVAGSNPAADTDTGNGFDGPAEIFNPESGAFSVAGNIAMPHAWFGASVLNNGQVLIAGGRNAGIFDPVSNSFRAAGNPLVDNHNPCQAVLLSNGRVLIAGGGSQTEIYDPATGTSSFGPVLSNAGAGFTVTLLEKGNVLVAGNSAELLLVD